MTTQVTSSPLFLNPAAPRLVDLAGFGPPDRGPLDYHAKLPGYALTPLVDLPDVAERLGVGRVVVKDEAERLGLPSYKILGASWATYQEVLATLQPDLQPWSTVQELAGSWRRTAAGGWSPRPTATTAGAVARMASTWAGRPRSSCRPARWTPGSRASPARAPTSSSWTGRTTRRSSGRPQEADDRSLVISDTAWPGYERVPRWVVEGYSTLFNEADDAMAAQGVPPSRTCRSRSASARWRRPRSGATGLARPTASPCSASSRPTRPACWPRSRPAGWSRCRDRTARSWPG
jgi:diaminopropionate ammonia-lyase